MFLTVVIYSLLNCFFRIPKFHQQNNSILQSTQKLVPKHGSDSPANSISISSSLSASFISWSSRSVCLPNQSALPCSAASHAEFSSHVWPAQRRASLSGSLIMSVWSASWQTSRVQVKLNLDQESDIGIDFMVNCASPAMAGLPGDDCEVRRCEREMKWEWIGLMSDITSNMSENRMLEMPKWWVKNGLRSMKKFAI